MRIVVLNKQKECRLRTGAVRKLAAFLMRRAGTIDRRITWGEVSFLLTDDDGIRPLNLRHFGRNTVTDVITFRYNPLPGEKHEFCGDVVVNARRAVEFVSGNGVGVRSDSRRLLMEIGLYLAHGCDHLYNEEDSDAKGRLRMRRRELRWLKEAEAEGLVTAIAWKQKLDTRRTWTQQRKPKRSH
jgi:ssRNA-specific RNase YbeY (16S rRNA maturation enzyme)